MPLKSYYVSTKKFINDAGYEDWEWNVCDKNLGSECVFVKAHSKDLADKICRMMNEGLL